VDNSFSNNQTLFPKSITDRYAIKKQIGHGGMGNVYLAKDTQLLRDVAIKAIRSEHLNNKEVLRRIDRECKMHAAIGSHPHIVSLFDRIDKGGNIFLIMEYIQGETLGALIKSTKSNKTSLSLEFIIEIIIQTLDALECIHRHGVIHRDIKPANIIVGGLNEETPFAKIMDFGIAKDLEEDDSLTRLTMLDSGGPGTPAYMAPERIDSATFGEIVPATDLYAIGIILFELFQKSPPFHGTMTEIFSGHLAKSPNMEELHHLPEITREILTKALEKYPSKRYQTAREFANDLKNANLICSDQTLPATAFDLSTLNINHDQAGSGNVVQTSVIHSKRWLTITILLLFIGVFAASIFFIFPQNNQQNAIATTPVTLPPPPPMKEPMPPENTPKPIPQPLPEDKPSPPEQDAEAARKAFEARQKEKAAAEAAEAAKRIEDEKEKRKKEEAERLKSIKLGEGSIHKDLIVKPPPRRIKDNAQSR